MDIFKKWQARRAATWALLDAEDFLRFAPPVEGGATDTSFGMVRVFDDFTGKALDTTNFYTTNSDTGGTAFAINEQRNGVIRGGTDGTDGDLTNLFKDPVIWRPNAGGLIFESRVTLITSIADGESFIGLTDDDGTDENPILVSTTDAATTNASNAAGFAYTGAGTADWKAVSVNADADGSVTRCNNGGATTPATTTWQTFRVAINTDGDADFYIDGIWQDREDAAVAASTSLCPGWCIQGGGTARSMDIDYVFVQVGRV